MNLTAEEFEKYMDDGDKYQARVDKLIEEDYLHSMNYLLASYPKDEIAKSEVHTWQHRSNFSSKDVENKFYSIIYMHLHTFYCRSFKSGEEAITFSTLINAFGYHEPVENIHMIFDILMKNKNDSNVSDIVPRMTFLRVISRKLWWENPYSIKNETYENYLLELINDYTSKSVMEFAEFNIMTQYAFRAYCGLPSADVNKALRLFDNKPHAEWLKKTFYISFKSDYNSVIQGDNLGFKNILGDNDPRILNVKPILIPN